MVYGSGSILVQEPDQVQRSTATAADPVVATIDCEIANIHASGVGNQNLSRNRISGRQARRVLHDATGRSYNDCGIQRSALNAGDGQSLVDLDLFRISTRADQDGPAWR